MPSVTLTAHLLPPATWTARAAAHAARAEQLTAARLSRRSRHESDPVEDFLFEYYPVRPAQLGRWHPGVGTALADGGGAPDGGADGELTARAGWRWHTRVVRPDGGTAVVLDTTAFLADRGPGVRWVAELLRRTTARPAQLGCLGLHEWAMVYRQHEHRHALPLRLGQDGTDAVVESHQIRCTHYDAFRFFTADARPRNRFQPERAAQLDLEQPGCLHANMDLLKVALKLGPACPGELLLDCFELARDIRVLDMEASPYDVTSLGRTPVTIETPAGRAEYIARQRAFSERAEPLRRRLLDVTSTLLGPG